MKKAKLMLVGIACLAVVGGAYALKANRTSVKFYSKIGSGSCSVTTSLYYTTIELPGAYNFTTALATAPVLTTTAPCPTIRLYSTN